MSASREYARASAIGCEQGRLLAWAEPVIGPDGRRVWTVECERMALCYRLAAKYCRGGYSMLHDSSASESYGSFAMVNNVARADYGSRTWSTILIRCKRDEVHMEELFDVCARQQVNASWLAKC